MGEKDAQVGELQIDDVERMGSQWIATGWVLDLGGDKHELSASGASRKDALELLEIKAWTLAYSETRWAVKEDTKLIELVDFTLRALRSGEAGFGNRIQTINMYERHRKFLTGEKEFAALGKLSLRQCSPKAVQAWLSLVARELPTSARHLKVLLSHAFDLAMRQEVNLWRDNPARVARLPHLPVPEPVEVTEEEFEGLLARIAEWEANGKRTDLTGIICCLMATGIRPGELPALLWDEVDLEKSPATITVSGCAVYQDNKLVRQPQPKTAAGFREIAIPEWFAEMLRERYGKRNRSSPYVFPSNTGTMLSMHNIGNRFREARGSEFRHIKLKSFRSTVATCIDREKGAEEAARQLGHTSPAITSRHYLKRAAQTGDNTDILEAFRPAKYRSKNEGDSAA